MTSAREKGTEAEEIAIKYLKKEGYEILEQNWFHHHHELDVVAYKAKTLIIIEVKSLASNFMREPYQAVNRNKQRAIISATNAYIRKNNINDDVRFDIISIVFRNSEPLIEHIENAFYPSLR